MSQYRRFTKFTKEERLRLREKYEKMRETNSISNDSEVKSQTTQSTTQTTERNIAMKVDDFLVDTEQEHEGRTEEEYGEMMNQWYNAKNDLIAIIKTLSTDSDPTLTVKYYGESIRDLFWSMRKDLGENWTTEVLEQFKEIVSTQ